VFELTLRQSRLSLPPSSFSDISISNEEEEERRSAEAGGNRSQRQRLFERYMSLQSTITTLCSELDTSVMLATALLQHYSHIVVRGLHRCSEQQLVSYYDKAVSVCLKDLRGALDDDHRDIRSLAARSLVNVLEEQSMSEAETESEKSFSEHHLPSFVAGLYKDLCSTGHLRSKKAQYVSVLGSVLHHASGPSLKSLRVEAIAHFLSLWDEVDSEVRRASIHAISTLVMHGYVTKEVAAVADSSKDRQPEARDIDSDTASEEEHEQVALRAGNHFLMSQISARINRPHYVDKDLLLSLLKWIVK